MRAKRNPAPLAGGDRVPGISTAASVDARHHIAIETSAQRFAADLIGGRYRMPPERARLIVELASLDGGSR